MNTQELILFFEKELKTLITELESYKDEENIWRTDRGISNSAGNLSLHLIGNLHAFIGKEIGKTNYVRNRELEFSQKDVSRATLINSINETIVMIRESLLLLSDEGLKNDYALMKFSKAETNEYLLVHLLKHLTYHLGQINYHRRLIDE